jgi:hypothetical protein
MPRAGKRGGYRGNTHRGGSRRLESNFVHSDSSTPKRGHKGRFDLFYGINVELGQLLTLADLTLAEEALNTERRESHWDSNSRLRYSKINFVSAGNLPQNKSKDAETAMADMRLGSPPQDPHEEVEDDPEEISREQFKDTAAVASSSHQDESTTPNLPSFIIDTLGDDSISTKLSFPRIRSPSPTPSDSSEEVILFGGRNNMGKAISRSTKSSKQASLADPLDKKIKIVEDKIHFQEELLEEALHRKTSSPPSYEELMTKQSTSPKESDGLEPVLPIRRTRGRKQGRGQRGGRQSRHKAAEQEAVLADYLANMDSEDREGLVQDSGFNARELGGTDDDAWRDETEMSSGEPHTVKEHVKGAWDDLNIEDLDDLSTSDGVMGDVRGIFSKRERKNGMQYLVVWEDQTMDDARWVPVTNLTSVSAKTHIAEFEAEESLVAQFAAASDEDDDDDDSMDGQDTADEDAEDEDDLLQRKIDRMTDEQIARLLAKQEELGMGSNELLLFDEAADADGEHGYADPNRSFNPFIPLSEKKNRSKRTRREFPTATALADAYDGFDVMDFERPSLKKKPKGRKGKLILDDVDDSELEEAMQAAWDNDRIKKKERKQEREELRARGLLGSKNGKADMKQKYKEGMGIQAVKDEIKRFLMGSDTT